MTSEKSKPFTRREIPVGSRFPDAKSFVVERGGEPQYYINRARKIGDQTLGITYYEPLEPVETSINGIHYVPGLLTPEGGVAPVAGDTALLGINAFTHESRRRGVIAEPISHLDRPKTAITYQAAGVVEATQDIEEFFGITKTDKAGHSMGSITVAESVMLLEPGDPHEPRSILGIAPAGYGQLGMKENIMGHKDRLGGMFGVELRPNFSKFLAEAPQDIKRQFLRHIGSAPVRAVMEGHATLSTNIGPDEIQHIKSRGIRVGRLDAELDQFVPPKIGNHINTHLDWRGEVKNGLHFDLMAHPLRTADDVISAVEALNNQHQSIKVA